MKRNQLRLALAMTFAIVAAGCATAPPAPVDRPETPVQASERRAKAPAPTYNLSGYPPAMRDGYIDGCESAKGSSLGRKDAKRFADDAQYAMGWNDGHAICKK
jgi:hypothetical protein